MLCHQSLNETGESIISYLRRGNDIYQFMVEIERMGNQRSGDECYSMSFVSLDRNFNKGVNAMASQFLRKATNRLLQISVPRKLLNECRQDRYLDVLHCY